MTAEDYRGRFWRRLPGHGPLSGARSHPCSDPSCLWDVTIQRDILGRWFARHQHSDFCPALRSGPSTVSSPRFDEWQLASDWAAERGLLAEER